MAIKTEAPYEKWVGIAIRSEGSTSHEVSLVRSSSWSSNYGFHSILQARRQPSKSSLTLKRSRRDQYLQSVGYMRNRDQVSTMVTLTILERQSIIAKFPHASRTAKCYDEPLKLSKHPSKTPKSLDTALSSASPFDSLKSTCRSSSKRVHKTRCDHTGDKISQVLQAAPN